MAFFSITSSQVEALCKARPPSTKPFRPAQIAARAEADAVLRGAKEPAAPRVPAGPRLNLQDLPEASVPTKHGRPGPVHRSSRHDHQDLPARVARQQPLARVLEDCQYGAQEDDEEFLTVLFGHLQAARYKLDSAGRSADADSDETDAADTPASAEQWPCARCTFLNDGALPRCEICDHLRPALAAGASDVRSPQVPPAKPPAEEEMKVWPTLGEAKPVARAPESVRVAGEAWALCDVSSVGSSWMDLKEDQALAADDASSWCHASEAGDARNAQVESAAPSSWAALLALQEGQAAPQPLPPRAPVHLCPRPRRAPPAALPESELKEAIPGSDDEEDEADQLWDKRMNPSTTRGLTQRRNMERMAVRRNRR